MFYFTKIYLVIPIFDILIKQKIMFNNIYCCQYTKITDL